MNSSLLSNPMNNLDSTKNSNLMMNSVDIFSSFANSLMILNSISEELVDELDDEFKLVKLSSFIDSFVKLSFIKSFVITYLYLIDLSDVQKIEKYTLK